MESRKDLEDMAEVVETATEEVAVEIAMVEAVVDTAAVVVVVTKLLNINPKCSRILAPNYHLPFLCIYQYLERSACLS